MDRAKLKKAYRDFYRLNPKFLRDHPDPDLDGGEKREREIIAAQLPDDLLSRYENHLYGNSITGQKPGEFLEDDYSAESSEGWHKRGKWYRTG